MKRRNVQLLIGLFAIITASGCGGVTIGTGLRFGGNGNTPEELGPLFSVRGKVHGENPDSITVISSIGTAQATVLSDGTFSAVLPKREKEPVRLMVTAGPREFSVPVELSDERSATDIVLVGDRVNGYRVEKK